MLQRYLHKLLGLPDRRVLVKQIYNLLHIIFIAKYHNTIWKFGL